MENNEMTEREMLEFAAKAYGFGSDSGGFIWTESEYPRGSSTNGALWNYKGWCDTAELWNPLTDDSDALRLAVKLGIVVDAYRLSAISGSRLSEGHNDWTHGDADGCCSDEQAVRYVITKVAAEIGKRITVNI